MIEVYGGKDSYIIGLEKSRHGKKCLSGLSCSKMFPLQIRTALCLQLGNKLYTHYKNTVNQRQGQIKITNLIEEVNYFGEDVETSSWVDGSLVENTSLQEINKATSLKTEQMKP